MILLLYCQDTTGLNPNHLYCHDFVLGCVCVCVWGGAFGVVIIGWRVGVKSTHLPSIGSRSNTEREWKKILLYTSECTLFSLHRLTTCRLYWYWELMSSVLLLYRLRPEQANPSKDGPGWSHDRAI